MTAQELRTKYLEFFKSKGHTVIPSASLIPRETDASTLFTTAGMHPLVPYLLGEDHPGGKRVVNVQKCVRTGDIDDVGDNRHCTFFEMMGNWSFGDYFKQEAIEWSWEFLTDKKWLGLEKNRIYVTVFKGENNIPQDVDSLKIWKETFAKAGMSCEVALDDQMITENVRIIPLGIADNFWIAGATGPCGGDTEMFYDVRSNEERAKNPLAGNFTELVESFKLIEIWNNVFMEFNKTAEGKYEKLAKPNVDTGMGVERTLTVLVGKENVFETELFQPLIAKISELATKSPEWEIKSYRIIADHLRAATFMLADGVTPSNTGAGYVLRRLIRRAVRYGKLLGIETDFTISISEIVIQNYGDFYGELLEKQKTIFAELAKEEKKFRNTLEQGLKKIDKELEKLTGKELSGKIAFELYATFGFPVELLQEILQEKGIVINEGELQEELKNHQELSRTASAGMFKGGLQDSGQETARLHTATHLLLAALRQVLGSHVFQKGSNITAERLRFDFSHGEKMTPEQIKEVENLVNSAIEANFEVVCETMSLEDAKKTNAMGVFETKYAEDVKVYSIVDANAQVVSREICGGPHAKRTGELGHFQIQKEEASSAGVRRIKATLGA